MSPKLELIYRGGSKKTTVFSGPSRLAIVPKFNTFRISQEGVELHKELLTKYKDLNKQYIWWFKNQSSLYLKEGITTQEFKIFPELAVEKVFSLYQMILDILKVEGDGERRVIDYALYITESFGRIPDQKGCVLFKDEVFTDVLRLVIEDDTIPEEPKKVILSILIEEIEKSELNALFDEVMEVFEKWKSTIPTELDFLGIKETELSFQDVLLHPETIINEFNKETYYRIRTKEEVIEELLQQTFAIFQNIEISSKIFDNPAKNALSISENKTKLQLAKISQQYDQSEITYLDAIIQSLQVIEDHLVKHKDTIAVHGIKTSGKRNGEGKSFMTISEAALHCVYSDIHITRENADHYVKSFNHNSGEKLFQKYIFWSSRTNRINPPHPNTKKKFENKVGAFKKVIDNLDKKFVKQATDELNLLMIKYKNDHV